MTDISPVHNSIDVFSEIILPSNKQELEIWARKNDLINSYKSIESSDSLLSNIDRTKRELIQGLLNQTNQLNEQRIQDHIFLSKSAIQAILNTPISDVMKKQIIQDIVAGYSPWMYPPIVGNIIKQIRVDEKYPGQTVIIDSIDFVGETKQGTVIIGGTSVIGKPWDPQELYTIHVANNPDYSPLEKKLVAYALDRKPYRSNEILTMSALKSITIDWSKGKIHFKGEQSRDLGYTFHMCNVLGFQVSNDFFRTAMKELYNHKEDGEYNVSVLRKKIEDSLWNQNFTPDFLQNQNNTY